MTSYEAGLSGSGGSADRLGHWGPQILIGSVLGSIAVALRPLPYGTPGAVLLPLGLLVLVVVSWVLMRQHDRRLCELCMSSMPLNAAETAARLHRRLAVTHLGSDTRLVAGYLTVLLGSNLLLAGDALFPWHLGELLWAAAQSSMIYLVLCYTSHRKLQPWCHRCSDGGGGERDDTPTPHPLPSGSAG